VEEKLWRTLEALRTGKDVVACCKDWWQLAQSDWLLSIDVQNCVIGRQYSRKQRPGEPSDTP
jgi:hypothetical protein